MKPGIKTTEFWLVIVANVLTQAGALDVPGKYKWIVTAATIIGYAISRGLAKITPAGGTRPASLEPAIAAISAAASRLAGGEPSRAAAPPSTRDATTATGKTITVGPAQSPRQATP